MIKKIYNFNEREEKDPIYSEEIQLNETTVYQGEYKNQSYCIYSDPQKGRNFEYDPYIKIYNNALKYKATALVRISMKTGKVVPNHSNINRDAGKGDLTFDKNVCNFLIKALPKHYTGSHSDYPATVVTVYDAIYYEMNNVSEVEIPRYPIPDFKKANGLK